MFRSSCEVTTFLHSWFSIIPPPLASHPGKWGRVAGKALDERKAEVRIQFKEVPTNIFDAEGSIRRNELVVRIQPDEAIWLNVVNKK